MTDNNSVTRRNFLAAGAVAVAVPAILHGADLTKEPVRVGHIGTGTRGWDLIKYTGAVPECKVVAVCDVYGPHLKRGLEACGNPEAKGYKNYHELLSDPKVEAVIIATPDHWHEQMVLDAVAAGKAVYCEKALTISVAAAKRMRAAVKKANTVFQLGHQGRQMPASAAAGKLISEGRIGPVTLVHTGRYFNGTKERAPWRWYGYYSHYDRPDPVQVVKDLDWEQWLGKLPKIDFNERHFWHWRCYWPYGTGQAGDLLSHEADQVQCVLRWGIPDTCMCTGLLAYYKDDREVPDTWLASYRFEKQNCSLTFEGCMNSARQQPPEYIGKEGQLIFNGIGQDASRFWIYPDKPLLPPARKVAEPSYAYDPAHGEKWPNHMDDFLQCVRTGGKPKCNIDEAFIEVVTVLMSVESYRLKREVRWDPAGEEIV
ncbi:MAG: Gfo/Idh/MocA family oxidoreductase [Kiritimatiellae bacterium]|nr:Gfo/Idh/MocA family oxidoreductase [Kiritimatiellia bacterium]MDD5521748.1 Gfo/Idh/MocA family oxidoreductase [Kiritimatiellia bacterium]